MTIQRLISKHTDQSGFTLLELLMVIVILSATAWMVVSVATNNTDQVRFGDTRNRLKIIREAIMGSSSPTLWEKGILGGYVVENGRLPDNIRGMIQNPAGYVEYGLVTPRFDPFPDINGINDGGETILSAEHRLMKGHRGIYLQNAVNDEYRDGWGTQTNPGSAAMDCPSNPGAAGSNNGNDLDTDNFGWCVTLVSDDMYIDSYGVDGQAGQLTGGDYETDISMSGPIMETDWLVNIQGQSVRIINQTGADINFATIDLRVSILAFINDGDDSTTLNNRDWYRVTTDTIAHTCLDGPDADALCNGTTAPSETTATFLATAQIPIGEHILILVDGGADNMPHTADDALYPSAVNVVYTKAKFFSRGGVPDLVIRIN